MIAIPVMRGRVAPVLNWCSRMLIFSAIPDEAEGQELWVLKLGPEERLQLLQEKGVNTLICGALSADLQHFATSLGFSIVPGVAGEVGEVLNAYWENQLDRPEFWLPGCQRQRRYRQNLGSANCGATNLEKGGSEAMPGGTGDRGGGRGQGGGQGGRCRRAAGGPGGPGGGQGAGMIDVCVCPACGAKAPHELGIPCLQVKCPQCGKSMLEG
jgi:predicted Fe-Mo cluster-binding NifX family protein